MNFESNFGKEVNHEVEIHTSCLPWKPTARKELPTVAVAQGHGVTDSLGTCHTLPGPAALAGRWSAE